MRLEQLIYFDAVSKWGSISKAAAKLYVSQSTVSAAISHLETELELTLVKRSQSGVSLTPQGRQALTHVQQALDGLSSLKAYAQSCQNTMESVIHLASAPCFSECILTGVLGSLLESDPEIHLHVQEMLHHRIMEELCAGHIDLGIIGYFQEEADEVKKRCDKCAITLHPLCKSRNYLYCRGGHPLLQMAAAHGTTLSDYPLLVNRHMIAMAAHAFADQRIREVDSYVQINTLIEQGNFIALLPDLFEQYAQSVGHQIVRLSNGPAIPQSCYSWVKLTSNPLLPAEKRLLGLIRRQMEEDPLWQEIH